MRTTILSLGLIGTLLLACGGSTGSAPQPIEAGTDGGGSGGCTLPAPADLNCEGCGGPASPICRDDQWQCPPAPPCVALPPADSGADALPPADSSTADANPATDAGFVCSACDPLSHYCEVSYPPPPNDGGSGVPTDTCLALPTCDAAPSCACLTFGPFCTCADDSGSITVTCPFHV